MTLPQGFAPKQQWPEFHHPATMPAIFKPEAVVSGSRGVRWRFWPFVFEEYMSDTEPVILKGGGRFGYVRIVKWHRLSRADVPPKWTLLSVKPDTAVGFVELSPGKEYAAEWSESARRGRKEWMTLQSNGAYRIETITWDEFKKAYPKSVVGKRIGTLITDTVDGILGVGGGSNIVCWGVRKGAEVVAGMVVLHSPTFNSAYYVAGFFLPETHDLPLMTGLFDHWFSDSQQKGIRFLHLGNFWLPGNPSEWKGFAAFKAKFGTQIVVYPPMLYRMMLG